MTDARNFLINTDYPMDKLVLVKAGSCSAPNGFGTLTIVPNHGLSFIPMPLIIWSNSSNFANATMGADVGMNDEPPTGQQYDAQGTASNIVVEYSNNTGSSKTVYYQLWCYAPSTVTNASVNATNTLGDNFIINTDYNYLKLAKAGRLTVGSPTYSHGLGYTPTVMIWYVLNTPAGIGSLVQSQYTMVAGSDQSQGIFISQDTLRWTSPGITYDAIEYRIYYDD